MMKSTAIAWKRTGILLGLLLYMFAGKSVALAQNLESIVAGVTNAPKAHKIQVSDPAMGREIEAAGGKLIANYGAYRLYAVDSLTPDLMRQPQTELRDSYNMITLHSGHLDTRKAEVRGLRQAVGSFAGKRLHLVQFAGPVQAQWRTELLAAGARIVSYIPENAYLIYGDAATLARVQTMANVRPQVQWEGRYRDEYKINPAARMQDKLGRARNIGTDLFDIQLVNDASANARTLKLLDQLKLEPFKRQVRALGYLNLIVRLDPSKLDQVAAQPEVVSILPYYPRRKMDERQDQIAAGNLSNGVPNAPGYLAWLASKGFAPGQFTNFVVDITDSGVDNGTTSPDHFGLYAGGNTANASRVVYSRYERTVMNANNSLEGCDGHGTINAHIIGGYDDYAGFPFADTNGYHYGLGVCPFVQMGVSVAFDSVNGDSFYYPNLNNLQADAYNSGARVSNNSWGDGGSSEGRYDSESQMFDALVRDAEPTNSTYPADGNQPMVVVFAAGNSGSNFFGGINIQSLSAPGTAKNVITVGAAESVQAIGGTDGSGIADSQADNANDLAAFSSRGPCADGRIKPDLVAPGTHITGGVVQATTDIMTYSNGLADACYDGSGVSGGPGGSLFWPTNQQFYTASSGTSQSAPCVAGGCALVLQYFLNTWSNLPSPAMTKAYLMNSARYLNGVGAGDTLPSDNQGMGEMNLGMAFDGTARILRDQLPEDLFTNSGQIRAITGVISNTNKPFRVTLAWTDAPGSLSGNNYNNNLDLNVIVGTNSYKGNVFNGAYSTTGGTADAQNNVESVFLPAGVSGNFAVTITGTSINSIGVPNTNNAVNQDFAIVVYNGVSVPMPVLLPVGTTVSGESCYPTNGVIDPGEQVTVNFGFQNIGTVGFSNVVATLLTNAGITGVSAPQSYGTLAAASSAVSQPFTFTANGPCGGNITTTLVLQDGASNLGTFNYTFPLGVLTLAPTFSENFDSVTNPVLPSGWTSFSSNAMSVWSTSTVMFDTSPNAAFAGDTNVPGTTALYSPVIPIMTASAQLTFMNSYDLESSPAESSAPTTAYDGGVLDIQIDNGPYMDILNAGGVFITNGYLAQIEPRSSNPLNGRQCWSGNSSGFIPTVVQLPAAAAGHNIQLRWTCGTDSGNPNGGTGWYIDTVSIADGFYTCCTPLVTPVIINPQVSPDGTSLLFSFQTVNGQTYSVQYKNDLNDPSWTTLQALTGDGTVQQISDSLTSPQRFYRIISP